MVESSLQDILGPHLNNRRRRVEGVSVRRITGEAWERQSGDLGRKGRRLGFEEAWSSFFVTTSHGVRVVKLKNTSDRLVGWAKALFLGSNVWTTDLDYNACICI